MNTPADEDRIDARADDAALADYLRRDSAVTQRYRELESAGVPPVLDHAVLAQARAAVAEKKGSRLRALRRWSAPLALAASVLVVVSIVMQPAMQQEVARSTMPASAPSPNAFPQNPVAADEAAAGSRDSDPAVAQAPSEIRQLGGISASEPSQALTAAARLNEAGADETKLERKAAESEKRVAMDTDRKVRQLAAVQAVPAPPPPALAETPSAAPETQIRAITAASRREDAAAADRALDETVITASKHEVPAVQRGGPRNTVPVVSAGNQATSDAEAGEALREGEPSQWLEYIRQLRRDGESRRADREWQRFRDKYPDYTVAAADLARARK